MNGLSARGQRRLSGGLMGDAPTDDEEAEDDAEAAAPPLALALALPPLRRARGLLRDGGLTLEVDVVAAMAGLEQCGQ